MDKNEARNHVRKMMTDAGVPEDEAQTAADNTPDEVLDAVMSGHDLRVVRAGLEELIKLILGSKDGHLPGCDGNHSMEYPEIGIELTDAADARDQLGAHGMGNIAVIIKEALSYVALEQIDGFRRYMADRERKHGITSAMGNRLSDMVTVQLIAWIALGLRHPHTDCPAYRGEKCPDGATVLGRDHHATGKGYIPDAFRKPRFSAGVAGVEDGGEPVIDPRMFGFRNPVK